MIIIGTQAPWARGLRNTVCLLTAGTITVPVAAPRAQSVADPSETLHPALSEAEHRTPEAMVHPEVLMSQAQAVTVAQARAAATPVPGTPLLWAAVLLPQVPALLRPDTREVPLPHRAAAPGPAPAE